MNKKINLYTLTGFLGSGKTTILKSILTDFQNQKIGVIQNEFGKLNIDGEILRNDKIKMI
ncbi:MAG: GTP-binding protein, partial [Oscillospiraceae bacterium]